jgi:hypothetical protein
MKEKLSRKRTRKLTKGLKGKKSRRSFRGGVIVKANFNARNNIKPYYAYAKLIEKSLLRKLTLNDKVCAGAIDDLTLLFGGANGFALQFKCSNGKIYTFKLRYELSQYWEGKLREKEKYKAEIKEEFLNINKFDSEYIMKALRYFFFEPVMGRFQIYSTAAGPIQSIPVRNIFTNPNYRQTNINGRGVGAPFFGGLVLEYVEKRFTELPSDKINVLLSVFIQYVEGLNGMNKQQYIHKDIKPDNLMFNVSETGEYTAKIIDLGELYNVNTAAISFTPASQELAPAGDVVKLQEITLSPPANSTRARNAEKKAIIESILYRYDLYCLAKSFLKQFNGDFDGPEENHDKIRTASPEFYELLQNCIKENYTERLSNDQAYEQAGLILSNL